MNSVLAFLRFPPAERRDAVRFYWAKDIPYDRRIFMAFGAMAAGIVIQIAFLSAVAGLPFLIAGVGLLLVQGYDSRARLKGYDVDPCWREVPLEKVQEIERLRERSKRWDEDAFDVSNLAGALVLIMAFMGLLTVAFLLGTLSHEPTVAVILILDAAVLLLPFWFTGMRFILKEPNLIIRTNLVIEMSNAFEQIRKDGERFRPAMLLAGCQDGKTVPTDVRFSVAFPLMPKGFYGLQSQININVVQGHSYPYFYCVLAARPGFGLRRFEQNVRTSSPVICEYQQDDKAEVLVIRQMTTKTSGYHTKPEDCAVIFRTALEAGRSITGQTESRE